MDIRYQPSSSISCPLCIQKSYLTSNSLGTEEELSNILAHVREALVLSRQHHASGSELTEPCLVCSIVLFIIICLVLLTIFTAPV